MAERKAAALKSGVGTLLGENPAGKEEATVAAVHVTAVKDSVTADVPTWGHIPDVKEAHVFHELTPDQEEQKASLLRVSVDVLVIGNIVYGKAEVQPYDLDLIEGGVQALSEAKSKVYPLKVP